MTKDKFETLMREITIAKAKLEAANMAVDRICLSEKYLDAVRGHLGHFKRINGKRSLLGYPVYRSLGSYVRSSAKFGKKAMYIEFSGLAD